MVTPLGGRLRQKTFSQRAAGSGVLDHAALSGSATSMHLHLVGSCLIDPATGTGTQAVLFISEGQIAGIGAPQPDFHAHSKLQTLDARGLVVIPGLVDLC